MRKSNSLLCKRKTFLYFANAKNTQRCEAINFLDVYVLCMLPMCAPTITGCDAQNCMPPGHVRNKLTSNIKMEKQKLPHSVRPTCVLCNIKISKYKSENFLTTMFAAVNGDFLRAFECTTFRISSEICYRYRCGCCCF